jgi:glyoxylase-like metal-dependent hydrolase (beta-lactamase superfamily II)
MQPIHSCASRHCLCGNRIAVADASAKDMCAYAVHLTAPAFHVQIIGPKADASRIPGIDVQVGDGDTWQFGQITARVYDTPGHTRGHITYWFPDAKALFPGVYVVVVSSKSIVVT